ncbi:MAG: dTDP-4-dehydrorhamnose 3,5-epimerase [Chthoniobacterales bacterium]|nr:dTDP-4-dehydrorhamnose 3,5-epimerase [Chthoniobacterales bacterium]
MKIVDVGFGGVHQVFLSPAKDDRGSFSRIFCREMFSEAGLNSDWPQINVSHTLQRGALRGLHFQEHPSDEAKLISCLTGSVFDVVVDVRRSSPLFGKWRSFELSEANGMSLYVPAGFAHGFQCLSDNCRLLYLMSANYEPTLARGVRYDDAELGIIWPLSVSCISPKDSALPGLGAVK